MRYFGTWHVERSGEFAAFGFDVTDEDTASDAAYREAQDLDPQAGPYPED